MRERVVNTLVWLGIFLSGIGLVVLLSLPALAQHSEKHMEGHAQFHEQFYSTWQRPNGLGSCCSDDDCAPIDDKDIRASENKVEVRIKDEWVNVPKETIRPYQAPDMRSHLCNLGRNIYCFVFGGGS
jgi:hypothetical protein